MVRIVTPWSYLEPLLFRNDWAHLAEISKEVKKNHSVVRQYLNDFESRGILEKKIAGNMTLYKVKDAAMAIDIFSVVEKLKLIERCGDLKIKEVADFLHNNLGEENKALIFGSSVIDMKRANDVDVLISGKVNFMNKIKDFEKIMNKKIHLINVDSLKDINLTLKKEIKSKHLIVQGVEEIVRWLI